MGVGVAVAVEVGTGVGLGVGVGVAVGVGVGLAWEVASIAAATVAAMFGVGAAVGSTVGVASPPQAARRRNTGARTPQRNGFTDLFIRFPPTAGGHIRVLHKTMGILLMRHLFGKWHGPTVEFKRERPASSPIDVVRESRPS